MKYFSKKSWLYLTLFCLYVVCILAMTACAVTEMPVQKLDPEIEYKYKMMIEVNGVMREGVITMPLLEKNKIHVIAESDLDLFVRTSCSGEWQAGDAWNVQSLEKSGPFGWFKRMVDKKNEIEFEYIPIGLEKNGSCTLNLYSISKKGVESRGMIDWQTSSDQLKGKLVCNGTVRTFDGVEICQTRKTLKQQITFNEDVHLEPSEDCSIGKNDGRDFEFSMPKKICVIEFLGIESRKTGRLTLKPYASIKL